MLDISTKSLQSRKPVKIDGHIYTVRRLGAGEELEIQSILRKLSKLSKQLVKSDRDFTEKEESYFDELQQRTLAIYAGLYDDGGDGTKSRELLSGLSYEDRQQLTTQIFSVESQIKDVIDGGESS